MFTIKKISWLMVFVVLCSTTMLAQQPQPVKPSSEQQQNFTDAELQKFAQAYQQVQVLSQGMQEKIMQMVQDEGMDVQRFNEIHQAKMTPGQEANTTPEEDKKHAAIVSKVETMQGQFEGQIMAMLKDQGISMEKYQQIAAALQTSQELQLRLQKIMQQ